MGRRENIWLRMQMKLQLERSNPKGRVAWRSISFKVTMRRRFMLNWAVLKGSNPKGKKGKGDQTAVEKIKSKKKRRSMKCEAQVENEEKIDPKPCCDGYDIRFVEDMQLENGKIKSMEKKAVEDELQETVDGSKTSKFKLKKTEPEVQKNTVQVGVRYVSPFHNDSSKKIHAKPLDNGSNPEPFTFPISKDLMGDKVEEDVNKNCLTTETITFSFSAVDG
ncbi:hypothetical protein VNO80_09934 [Phaseolus coccineus]|uniref:Uncharacterized protein n=1 Tax=Phaseolus coccineus TaxID=3886 RepID=A0AAN9NCJ8_PHACN